MIGTAMPTGAPRMGVASSGHLRLTPTRIHGTCTSTLLALPLGMAAISHAAYLSAASPFYLRFPSRALRSLPLSVMMSGNLGWSSGDLFSRGTYGFFWASTPYSYASSRLLYFRSANVDPKNGGGKPSGYTLRCVALCAFVNGASRSLRASNRCVTPPPVTTGGHDTGDIDKCA